MGLFSAMTTSISGLRAQSFALEHISGNIANSQTIGFKRTETSFADLIPESSPRRQVAGGVNAFSRATNTVQGDIRSSDVETHMAVNGDGYFIVEMETGQADNLPVFSGVDRYTRRGDFELDRDGYIVNGAGYFLKGFDVDADTGNLTGSLPKVIQITNDFLPAKETEEITYRVNVASYPRTAEADANDPGSELIDPASYTADPTTIAGPNPVPANEAATFIDQSVAGGAITAYDPAGQAVNVQMRWAKLESASYGGDDVWNLFYLHDSNATGADPAWLNTGQEYSFNTSGQLDPAVETLTLSALTIDGVTIGDVNLKHGKGGVTQFADANGVPRVTEISQNGYAAGELSRVSFSEDGRLVTSYTNGRSIDIAEVQLATFNSDGNLRKIDGGAFEQTTESGQPIIGGTGSIVANSLEGSNTDIADEFSKLIVTQQAYAAGTRILSTADEMMKETLSIVR